MLDATGFDLNEVSKEDLHKETVERSLSAMSVSVAERLTQTEEQGQDGEEEPVEKEEMVTRGDYDRLMRTHTDEMEMLQNEYE